MAVPAVAVVLAGCGAGPELAAETDPTPVTRPSAIPPADGPVRGVGTVLDDGTGPELCLGGVASSYPPQCDGVPVTAWDWSSLGGRFEHADGVRWGSFTVTGTFDGTTLTVTEPPTEAEWPERVYDFGTRCPEPSNGWRALDPLRTNDEARSEAVEALRAAGHVRQPLPGRGHRRHQGARRPRHRDVAAAEAVIREHWGGTLCVSPARTTEAERLAAMDDVMSLPGIVDGNGDHELDRVLAGVVHDDGSFAAWAKQEYGDLVVVESKLVPVTVS